MRGAVIGVIGIGFVVDRSVEPHLILHLLGSKTIVLARNTCQHFEQNWSIGAFVFVNHVVWPRERSP
jgi:hypothetical protein